LQKIWQIERVGARMDIFMSMLTSYFNPSP
jgi:hypothetical protein